MDNGDIGEDIGEGKTSELAWMRAAEFLNKKRYKMIKLLDEGMWDGF